MLSAVNVVATVDVAATAIVVILSITYGIIVHALVAVAVACRNSCCCYFDASYNWCNCCVSINFDKLRLGTDVVNIVVFAI